MQRKTSQTDQAGVTISYNFDMANRLLQRSYPDNLNDVFQYDPASRLTQAISNRYVNTVTRSYNNDGTIATEGLSTNSQNYQISHLYDNAKRSYQTNYPNGKVVTKAFTARNQLASIAYDNAVVANFTYDPGKRETTRGLGNGLTQVTNYNLDNTIQQKSVAGITNFSYTYNANKQKLTETDAVNTNLNQTFAYDFENRLTSWSSNGTTLNQTQSWNLSLEGAWNTNTINGVAETRTFNAAYETLNSNKNSINSPLTHDRKGNLTQNKDGSLYTWDFDNQLSFSVAGTPSVNASYAYDALGRRISKTSNNTTTIYVSANYQIATEYKSINSNPFIETQSYVYASYIDDPLALINSNGRYYYHSNHQFSVSKLTDSSQNIVESYAYNAYGDLKILQNNNAVDNTYFFTGRQLDFETGLHYFRARYYDAKLGQFISRDPIGYVDGMNLYRGYFAIDRVDPFGLADTLLTPGQIQAEENQSGGVQNNPNLAGFRSQNGPAGVLPPMQTGDGTFYIVNQGQFVFSNNGTIAASNSFNVMFAYISKGKCENCAFTQSYTLTAVVTLNNSNITNTIGNNGQITVTDPVNNQPLIYNSGNVYSDNVNGTYGGAHIRNQNMVVMGDSPNLSSVFSQANTIGTKIVETANFTTKLVCNGKTVATCTWSSKTTTTIVPVGTNGSINQGGYATTTTQSGTAPVCK